MHLVRCRGVVKGALLIVDALGKDDVNMHPVRCRRVVKGAVLTVINVFALGEDNGESQEPGNQRMGGSCSYP